MPTETDFKIEDTDEENDVAVTLHYDIATYPSDFTLSGIAQMWKDEDIKIPGFQREFVWTIRQSSLLIDSFLCGLPVLLCLRCFGGAIRHNQDRGSLPGRLWQWGQHR